MYTAEIESLIHAAQDARHCLCAVNDESLRSSIDRVVTDIEKSIAEIQQSYGLSLPAISLPSMEWVKELPRPKRSKDAFIEMREREEAEIEGWPFK